MKKIALSVLLIVLLVVAYAYGTLNARKVISLPAAQWAGSSEAAQAWREFAASLESAGARIYGATDDAVERTEGLQYLAQLAAASLEMKLAKGSPEQPALSDWMSDYRKFLGDSPDAIYHTAELSPAYRYEITGNKGEAGYLGFMLYGRQLNGWNRPVANLSSELLQFDEAGNFSIVVSREAPAAGQDWLAMEDDVHTLMVRQYYHGRAGRQEARLHIRNLDTPPVGPVDDGEVAAGLRNATAFFNDTVDGTIALAGMLAGSPNSTEPPASYNPDFGGVFYPTLDNEYFGGWFNLQEDEALVIEGSVPDAPYWSVSLQNRWLQSLEGGQVALNDRQIETDNGRYKVILAHRRPPAGNWLDTGGRREGLLAIRYQLSEDSERPSLRVVKFDQL